MSPSAKGGGGLPLYPLQRTVEKMMRLKGQDLSRSSKALVSLIILFIILVTSLVPKQVTVQAAAFGAEGQLL